MSMNIDAAEVEAFITARLAEDEQDCLDAKPGRRYHDPEWGLGLVRVLRATVAREPKTLLRVASVWSDHSDYAPRWRLDPQPVA
jgi:hypothetical protein